MHGKTGAARVLHLANEIAQLGVTVPAVDADAVLNRYRDRDGVLHCLNAIRHQGRVGHQDRANHVVLHPVAGAADVEVHLVVAGVLGHAGAGGQVGGDATAQLQGEWMLGLVMAQETFVVAVEDCAGGDHLGVEEGVFGQQAQKVPAVPVSPIHHGGDGEATGEWSGL